MSLLIINATEENNIETQNAISKLTAKADKYKVINTSDLNISHCTGCKTCMFKTPGVCCLKDDYKTIEIELLRNTDVIIISDTSLNFLSYKTIRLLERRFPWAVVFCEYRDNKIRHVRRYNHQLKIGVLYTGFLDNNMLNEWLSLYTHHGNDISLGAFHINDVEELLKCISQ